MTRIRPWGQGRRGLGTVTERKTHPNQRRGGARGVGRGLGPRESVRRYPLGLDMRRRGVLGIHRSTGKGVVEARPAGSQAMLLVRCLIIAEKR